MVKIKSNTLKWLEVLLKKFNANFGNVFTIPEPEIVKETQLIPGVDGQKMSKSYNNTIPIFGEDKLIRRKVMSIKTDTTPVNQPKDKDTTLFHLYCLFADKKMKDLFFQINMMSPDCDMVMLN